MKKKLKPTKTVSVSSKPITHAILKQVLARELKQFTKEIDEMHRRHMGALSEQFQGQVSAVAEQFLGLNEKVDHMNKTLNSHTEMIGGMMEDIEVVKSNVEFLKAGIRTKVDYPDYHSLERRVRLIESKIRR